MKTKVRALLSVIFLCMDASASSGSLELGLSGGWVARADGAREVVALLTLELPLDRRRAARVAPGLAEPPAATEKPAARPARALSLVTPELAHAAIRAALRASGRARAEARYGSLSSRARSSAALPELRLRASRTTDESLRLSPTAADPYRYTQAGGVSVALEAQATWKLDRAVFADEELQIEHLRRLRARKDERLVEDVLKALFAWQRAASGAADPDAPPDEQELAELRVVEAEVRLDVLTGGWFSVRAAALRKRALARRRRSE